MSCNASYIRRRVKTIYTPKLVECVLCRQSCIILLVKNCFTSFFVLLEQNQILHKSKYWRPIDQQSKCHQLAVVSWFHPPSFLSPVIARFLPFCFLCKYLLDVKGGGKPFPSVVPIFHNLIAKKSFKHSWSYSTGGVGLKYNWIIERNVQWDNPVYSLPSDINFRIANARAPIVSSLYKIG